MALSSQEPQIRAEMAAFAAALPELLREHSGEYVVIKGSQITQCFRSYAVALDWAYDNFGLDPFLVKKIDADHLVIHYTRDLGPWRA